MNIVTKQDLNLLIGSRFSDIGRSGDMLWLCFGDEIQWTDLHGNIRNVNEFSLHVQSAWRITDGEQIVLASNDIFITTGEDDNWDTEGANLFDEKKSAVLAKLGSYPVVVEKVNLNENGDLRIAFSNSLTIEVFVISSTPIENWRLINFKSENDSFIVFDEVSE